MEEAATLIAAVSNFKSSYIHLLDENPIKFKGCLNLVTHKQEKWKHSKSW
jgi:hypothetical protein